MNNCVGCFHRSTILLKHMSNNHSNKFDWFIDMENKAIESFNLSASWKNGQGPTYQQIKNSLTQMSLFNDDFNECDSGYCGL